MLLLHFAPSLDNLVPVLLSDLRQVWKDPFAPPDVIVPSPALGKWLRMRLADGRVPSGENSDGPSPLGCVANLEMQTLERFLWSALSPDADMELLDVERLGHVVFGLFDKQLLQEEIYGPLRNYLEAQDDNDPDPLKRVQLSSRIARQFLEYEFNRPSVWDEAKHTWRSRGIDACWLSGTNYAKDSSNHEQWQKDLYRRADKFISLSAQDGAHLLSLPRLYRLRREKGLPNGPWAVSPRNIFLFGVTKVSHFHRNVLVEISQMDKVTLDVFLTNPCAEFWEDVDTRRSRSVRRSWKSDSAKKDAAIATRGPDDYKQENLDFANLPDDHPLLELWGGAGKENIFLWCPQAQWNFEYHSPGWADSGETPATLLKAVQYSLLRGQSDLPKCKHGWTSDGSLLMLACPDRGREIEELREQILDMVSAGKIDTLNEAVVYLPNPAEYAAHIQRVFGAFRPGEPGHIPFSILAAPGSDSVFSQGMRVFLELAAGPFDRPRVFSFLDNPIVRASLEISEEDINAWERWAEALGIFRGFDRAHREQMGDVGEAASDAHTFELGMARMLVGDLAAGPVELDYLLLDNKDDGPARIPPYRDFDTAERGRLEKFCFAVEQLHRDCAGLKTAAEAGDGAPVAVLTEITRRWFGTIPDSGAVDAGAADAGAVDARAEARVLREFLDSLQSISPFQRASLSSGNGMFREVLALAASCLPGELAGGSAAWTGGITFAPLRPAMIVPHRVVFAAGLGATAFPGTADRPSWDLLAHRRIMGDSDPVRDNRFAFLELLHAARERLVLSFVSRDMQKEQDLQPSSVVLELEAYLAHQTPAVNSRRDIPWIVHESLDDICRSGRPHGTWDPVGLSLARLAAEPGRTLHRHDLPRVQAASGIPPVSSAAALRTNIFNLRKFFANPLEYHLSRTLGIEIDEEPATADASDEPLESGALGVSSLEKDIWKELLQRVFPPEKKDEVCGLEQLTEHAQAIAAREYADHVASGNSPEAQFLSMERQKLLQWAVLCAEATFRLRKQFPDHVLAVNTDLSLGRAGASGELRLTLRSGAACLIECRHGLALVPRKPEKACGCVALVDFKKDGNAADNPGLWLSGVLQWITGKDNSDGLNISLVQLNRGEGKSRMPGVDCADMKENCEGDHDIKAWLTALLQTMLVDRCSDHLPFASVQVLYKDDWNNVTADALSEELESRHTKYRCYQEAFSLVDARVPQADDPELRGLAKARFGPMLERWVHE